MQENQSQFKEYLAKPNEIAITQAFYDLQEPETSPIHLAIEYNYPTVLAELLAVYKQLVSQNTFQYLILRLIKNLINHKYPNYASVDCLEVLCQHYQYPQFYHHNDDFLSAAIHKIILDGYDNANLNHDFLIINTLLTQVDYPPRYIRQIITNYREHLEAADFKEKPACQQQQLTDLFDCILQSITTRLLSQRHPDQEKFYELIKQNDATGLREFIYSFLSQPEENHGELVTQLSSWTNAKNYHILNREYKAISALALVLQQNNLALLDVLFEANTDANLDLAELVEKDPEHNFLLALIRNLAKSSDRINSSNDFKLALTILKKIDLGSIEKEHVPLSILEKIIVYCFDHVSTENDEDFARLLNVILKKRPDLVDRDFIQLFQHRSDNRHNNKSLIITVNLLGLAAYTKNPYVLQAIVNNLDERKLSQDLENIHFLRFNPSIQFFFQSDDIPIVKEKNRNLNKYFIVLKVNPYKKEVYCTFLKNDSGIFKTIYTELLVETIKLKDGLSDYFYNNGEIRNVNDSKHVFYQLFSQLLQESDRIKKYFDLLLHFFVFHTASDWFKSENNLKKLNQNHPQKQVSSSDAEKCISIIERIKKEFVDLSRCEYILKNTNEFRYETLKTNFSNPDIMNIIEFLDVFASINRNSAIKQYHLNRIEKIIPTVLNQKRKKLMDQFFAELFESRWYDFSLIDTTPAILKEASNKLSDFQHSCLIEHPIQLALYRLGMRLGITQNDALKSLDYLDLFLSRLNCFKHHSLYEIEIKNSSYLIWEVLNQVNASLSFDTSDNVREKIIQVLNQLTECFADTIVNNSVYTQLQKKNAFYTDLSAMIERGDFQEANAFLTVYLNDKSNLNEFELVENYANKFRGKNDPTVSNAIEQITVVGKTVSRQFKGKRSGKHTLAVIR